MKGKINKAGGRRLKEFEALLNAKGPEVELRSMKGKKNKAGGRRLKEFEALLDAEKDQLTREIRATINAENAIWRKEFDQRMEAKRMEQMEKTLRAELKSKEEWKKQVDAKMERQVKMREQMEKELRAEFKLWMEEHRMKLEEERAMTKKSLQNMTYALSQALLKNDLVPLHTLYVGLGDDPQARFPTLLNNSDGTKEPVELAGKVSIG